MSKAVVFAEYGGPEVLEVVEVDPASPAAGEARMRVAAAGMQPVDCLFRSGRAAPWMPASFPQGLGNEFAGVVEAVGEGVETFSFGDEVLGWAPFCSHAEHVVVSTDQMVAKPASMPWLEAGATSASGQTAATALRLLEVGDGDTVLIHAAAGGVGSFAVQIARAKGASVIGTGSPPNHDYLRSLGAEPIAYGPGLEERIHRAAPDGVDLALDASGTEEALRTSIQLTRDRDRVATVAFSPAANKLGIPRLSTERSTEQLAALVDLHVSGQLVVEIQRAYSLQDAVDAHRAVETGHTRGKIVLTP